jgi:hypothetical protein
LTYDLNDSSYAQAQHNAAVGAVAQPGVILVAEGAVGTYLPVAFADDTSPLAAVVAPNFQAAVAEAEFVDAEIAAADDDANENDVGDIALADHAPVPLAETVS